MDLDGKALMERVREPITFERVNLVFPNFTITIVWDAQNGAARRAAKAGIEGLFRWKEEINQLLVQNGLERTKIFITVMGSGYACKKDLVPEDWDFKHKPVYAYFFHYRSRTASGIKSLFAPSSHLILWDNFRAFEPGTLDTVVLGSLIHELLHGLCGISNEERVNECVLQFLENINQG